MTPHTVSASLPDTAEPGKLEVEAKVEVATEEPKVEGGEDFPSEDFPAPSDAEVGYDETGLFNPPPSEDFPAPSEAAHAEVGHDETGLFNPPAIHVPLGTQEPHPGEWAHE